MFMSGKTENVECLFNELYHEIRTAAPCGQISYQLRSRLERCHPDVQKAVCSMIKEGSSLLFMACKKGNVEIVEYLLSTFKVDVEQKGMFEVSDDSSVHNVTPLWCAAVAGKVKVVEVLVKYGADVNSISDTGSTPVRSACFMTHIDIVKLLVRHRADIQKANYNGGTCLINSVQSMELCEFLLQQGAQVNAQDIQNKTALHYAIQEHRFDTAKLLLRYGADPHLVSKNRDDALQTACLKGAADIFEYLVDHVAYSPERIASAFELIGSTYIDEHHDFQKALSYWRVASDLRLKLDLQKPQLPTKQQYAFHHEFQTWAQLEAMSLDLDALRMQSLLICERVLSSQHKDMIYRLMNRGASYADSLQYQRCIDLWKYALQLRVRKDSILCCDTCFTAQLLVKLLLDLHDKSHTGLYPGRIRIDDVVSTIEILMDDVAECAEWLDVSPKFRFQQESYDKVLVIITHLLHLATSLISTADHNADAEPQQQQQPVDLNQVRRRIHNIVYLIDPRTTSGDSLLHLSVMTDNIMENENLFEEGQYAFFPSMEVTKLLIQCGARINAMNLKANTPLHVASLPNNFRQEIVETLLDHGAHIDTRNADCQRPIDMFKHNPDCKINCLQYTSLKCLAAAVIARFGLSYKNEIPGLLESFVEAH